MSPRLRSWLTADPDRVVFWLCIALAVAAVLWGRG